MIWQDALLSFGGFFLACTLLPMLRRTVTPPPLVSSAPIAVVLASFALAMFTLELYWGAAGTITQAAIWSWLALRRAVWNQDGY